MTLNKFQADFDQTQTYKSFGAEIVTRVENGRAAFANDPQATKKKDYAVEGVGLA